MNQPHCPICGEFAIHPALHAGVAWDVFYTDEFMREHQAMLAEQAHTCPECGQPVPVKPTQPPVAAPTPTKDTNVAHEAPPSGWREREPLL